MGGEVILLGQADNTQVFHLTDSTSAPSCLSWDSPGFLRYAHDMLRQISVIH
jgi:hypothetical protein